MRSRSRSQSGSRSRSEGRPLELVRVRGSQRRTRNESGNLRKRSRRRGGRSRGNARPPSQPPRGFSLWNWLRRLFGAPGQRSTARSQSLSEQESKVLAAFQQHYRLTFADPDLLKLALTHRSYLSVTGQGPRESNERLEFLGDSVLGLVTSEFLYRENPTEHEGQLTKAKSLLVSKAILSRRALAMGLGRFVLMSHSEVESGGRQRLSIIADAFESVVGAIYLDQGFEAARAFIHRWLLRDSGEIVADKRHTNYKSHLQEYVQSTFHTHPVYRIRGEAGPDHSKHFQVEVMVGKRVLGEGRGRNKKEAEQAAARDALEKLDAGPETAAPERPRRSDRDEASRETATPAPVAESIERTLDEDDTPAFASRGRRSGRRSPSAPAPAPVAEPPDRVPVPKARPDQGVPLMITPPAIARIAMTGEPEEPKARAPEIEPPPPRHLEDVIDELGRPEGPLEERHIDPYGFEPEVIAGAGGGAWDDPVVASPEPDVREEPAAVPETLRPRKRTRDEPMKSGPREPSALESEPPESEASVRAVPPREPELRPGAATAPEVGVEPAREAGPRFGRRGRRGGRGRS
jgi:ribonuclease-3